MSSSALAVLPNRVIENQRIRGILSHYIRQRQRGANWPMINSDELNRVCREGRVPTAQEQADNLIRWLGDHLVPGESVIIDNLNHGGIIGASGEDGFLFIAKGLMYQKLIEMEFSNVRVVSVRAVLLFEGWQRYEELKRGDVASTMAFMAMPFGETSIQAALDDCFRPAVEATGFLLEKLNDRPRAGLIDDRLRVAIQSCRFLIADVSHNNRGAYWEAGYAEGLKKPVIYTCEASRFDPTDDHEGVHFDTNHHLTVLWTSENFADAAEELKATIRATIPEARREDLEQR